MPDSFVLSGRVSLLFWFDFTRKFIPAFSHGFETLRNCTMIFVSQFLSDLALGTAILTHMKDGCVNIVQRLTKGIFHDLVDIIHVISRIYGKGPSGSSSMAFSFSASIESKVPTYCLHFDHCT